MAGRETVVLAAVDQVIDPCMMLYHAYVFLAR